MSVLRRTISGDGTPREPTSAVAAGFAYCQRPSDLDVRSVAGGRDFVAFLVQPVLSYNDV
ncbi:hypothetical protein [Accumulibacter sp.]|uniref:hypothetical protein n=1 Tax=Accumulibacter sp. TaxID=2053492 RepID=UPI0035B358E0